MSNIRVLVVPDGHYFRSKNGEIYVQSVFNYKFFSRYLEAYKEISVLARITYLENAEEIYQKASGEGVSFIEFPNFVGPVEYAKQRLFIGKELNRITREYDFAVFRLPGATANIMCKVFSKLNKAFIIEVVADPWEYFKPGTVKSILRPLIRVAWTYDLKKLVKKAIGVSYVTNQYLQSKYPSKPSKEKNTKSIITASYSSVDLPLEVFSAEYEVKNRGSFIISHVANSFNTYGKGHIVLMDAVSILKEKGFNICLVFIGDGPLMGEFKQYAYNIGIGELVEFKGRLSSTEKVREVLINTDIFVFPTMAEGLPRALLEAMALGLPAISSPVCGIPEILDSEFLVAYNNPRVLADKIIMLINSPEIMKDASKKNRKVAFNFNEDILKEKRNEFYKKSILRAEKKL